MDLNNFGSQQLNDGSLNQMLEQVGINDVGSFLNQFRNQAQRETQRSHQTSRDEPDDDQPRSGGGNNSLDMIQGAMNAYNTFSGGSGGSSGSGGGFFNNISSTYQNAQKMYALYKQFDRNGDGKITADDIQIYLQEVGLGAASPYLAKALFQTVDQNHNGSLDFTDLMALTALLNKLYGQYGGFPR
ncbi:unnamed protein product [Rotaria sordida]|uniref:EF-hand domain-containing protein n=1 Tax=Rotaria sordida TaxID=392033 RepID=A0A814U0R6_9BILA|nr:unnamed protein product [Rotaria sordida]CAF3854669.1 unnamed protein product [Rotaria sordida]